MAGLVPRLSGSAKMVATPPADSHWSQLPAVSNRSFGVRDLAFFRRSLPQLSSETSGPVDRKNSQSTREFVLHGQASVSTRLSAVQTEPDSRGLVPAIHAVPSRFPLNVPTWRRRVDGRDKPGHDGAMGFCNRSRSLRTGIRSASMANLRLSRSGYARASDAVNRSAPIRTIEEASSAISVACAHSWEASHSGAETRMKLAPSPTVAAI